MPPSGGTGEHETGPVFADPSGQRRRLMRLVGAGVSVLLVGALILAGIGLFGGPNTPLSVFGAHGQSGTGGAGKQSGAHSAPGRPAPGSGSSSSRPGQHTSPTRSGSPSHSAAPSPTA